MLKNYIHELIQKTENDKISSKELNIFQTFETKNIFKIKEFQRKYEWTKIEINELIKEINENKNNTYFLGMIIIKKEKIDDKEMFLNIIDGQQRITTLFLILKSVEKNIKRFKPDDEKEKILKEIKNVYLTIQEDEPKLKISKIRGEEELKNILIKNNFDEKEYKADNINEENPIYSQHFKNIDEYFNDKDIKFLLEFYEKIKLINFSIVIIGQKINEYKVFEDLNSKGVDLKIDDLIRNYFAQKITNFDKNKAQDCIDQYEILLKEIEVFLKNEKNEFRGFFSDQIGRWFKNYILYKVDFKKALSDTNDKRMYKLYKDNVNNKIISIVDLYDEIHSIEKYLKFCKWINKNDVISQDYYNEKYLINDGEMYAIFFEFYKNFEKENFNFEKILKLFSLIYISAICLNWNLRRFNKEYLEDIKIIFLKNSNNFYDAASQILKKMNFNNENVLKIIEKKIAEDSPILNEPKMEKFIKYFFAKMILDKTSKKIQLKYKNSDYNIEHIIPKKPDWEKIKDEDKKIEIFNLWFINVNRIKNLALIEVSLNEKLKNKFYWEKKKLYNKLKNKNSLDFKFIETTNEIFSFKEFGQKQLDLRFKKIKNFSKKFAKDILNWKN